MAHQNIFERQAHVRRLIKEGTKISAQMKKELAEKYSCSISAIFADIIAIQRPNTKETPFQSAAMRKRIFERDGSKCQYCGDIEAYEYIVEHVIPAAIGGVATEYNLVIACQKCNTKKRRNVWTPKNIYEITREHPEWRKKVLGLSVYEPLHSSGENESYPF